MKRLPVIQSLWIGDALSKLEQLSIQSYIDHGHEFHLYAYGDIANVPPGASVKFAGDILPKENIFRSQNGSVSGFANWFRYEMLCKLGGFWVDCDTVCMKPFDFGDEFVVGKEVVDGVCNAVIGGRHEVLVAMRESCRRYPKEMPWDKDHEKLRKRKFKARLLRRGREGSKFGVVGGPLVLTLALRHFGVFEQAKPHTYFYPIHYGNWDSIFDDTFANGYPVDGNTYCIHFWHNFLVSAGHDKDSDFPHDSLIEQLKRKHNIK